MAIAASNGAVSSKPTAARTASVLRLRRGKIRRLSVFDRDLCDGFDDVVDVPIPHGWIYRQGNQPLVFAVSDREVIGSVAVGVAIVGVEMDWNEMNRGRYVSPAQFLDEFPAGDLQLVEVE